MLEGIVDNFLGGFLEGFLRCAAQRWDNVILRLSACAGASSPVFVKWAAGVVVVVGGGGVDAPARPCDGCGGVGGASGVQARGTTGLLIPTLALRAGGGGGNVVQARNLRPAHLARLGAHTQCRAALQDKYGNLEHTLR